MHPVQHLTKAGRLGGCKPNGGEVLLGLQQSKIYRFLGSLQYS